MNIDNTKERPPLGRALANLDEWKRLKIKKRLRDLGITQGQWKGYLIYAEAYKLPAFVRDVIVEELPDTAELFSHPQVKSEKVA
jgi:hypothetical protein